MPDLEEIVRELAEIPERLDALPEDAFLERIEMRERMNELRAEAMRLEEATPSDESVDGLLAHLANLRRQRDVAKQAEISEEGQAGSYYGGYRGSRSMWDAAKLNRQIRVGRGLPELEEQIAQIERELFARGVDPR